MNTNTSPLLYKADIAQYLGRSESQVSWMIHTGQLKTALIGGRRAMRKVDLDAWIDAQFDAEHGSGAA